MRDCSSGVMEIRICAFLNFALLRWRLPSGIVLSGCAYGMYGDPYGYGYGPYSSASRRRLRLWLRLRRLRRLWRLRRLRRLRLGYGGYGYGGYDPFGWYGDYYYPGSGIYVYDRYRNRHRWNDDQRRYWQDRRSRWQNHSGTDDGSTARTGAAGTVRTRDRTLDDQRRHVAARAA